MPKHNGHQAAGLTEIVFWRMAMAAALAVSIQIAVCLFEVFYEYQYFERHYVAQETAKIVRGARFTGGVLNLDLNGRLAYYSTHRDRYAYRVSTPGGETLAGSFQEMFEPLSPLGGQPAILPQFWLHHIDTSTWLHFAGGMMHKVDGKELWVEVATLGDPEFVRLEVLVSELVKDVGIPMMPLIVITMLFATFAVRRSLRPLVQAAHRAEMITVDDRGEQFSLAGLPREAASFAGAINRLLDRTGALLRSQKQLVSHAAHELRTPLAIMLLELGKIKDPTARRLEADVAGMSETVNRLLSLARIEAMAKPGEGDINLAAMTQQIIDQLAPLAETCGKTIRLSFDRPTVFSGDAASIFEAVRNLVENAIRHTPPGSTVQITCGPGGSVKVEDDGPGVPEQNAASLFEPFRKGKVTSGGTGLGLAIVKRAVELHKGTVEVGRSTMGGAMFSMRFRPDLVET
jgi:signal transduction histidine kinase